MARENNLYNASVTYNKKQLNNNLYNNSGKNKIIQNAKDKINNSEISTKVSDGTIYMSGTGNVKNAISGFNSSSNIDSTVQNTPNILSMTSVLKKYDDNLTKVNIESTDTKEKTIVASDPDQPDNINDRLISSTEDINNVIYHKDYNFSLDNLYYTTKHIDINENRYTNTLNNEEISKDRVISASDHGIIVENPINNIYSMPTYKMIPSEYLEQQVDIEGSEADQIPIERLKHYTFGQCVMHRQSINYGIKTKDILKYKYNYNLDNISVSQNLVAKTAGFISSEIDVSNCGWIEVEIDNPNNVELYIVEERNETPILPKGVTRIYNEKLFYGLMPRFTIQNPDTMLVYKNGELTAINSLDDLYLFLSVNNTNVEVNQSSYLQENEYTISYDPDTSATVYFPNTDKVRLKIIKRNIINTLIEDIGTVKIYKYNNKTNWTLSSLDDESGCAPTSNLILT